VHIQVTHGFVELHNCAKVIAAVLFESADQGSFNVVAVGHFVEGLSLVKIHQILVQHGVLNRVRGVCSENSDKRRLIVFLDNEFADLVRTRLVK